MGLAPKIKELDQFIEMELISIKQVADQMEVYRNTWNTLNQYFMQQVTEWNQQETI